LCNGPNSGQRTKWTASTHHKYGKKTEQWKNLLRKEHQGNFEHLADMKMACPCPNEAVCTDLRPDGEPRHETFSANNIADVLQNFRNSLIPFEFTLNSDGNLGC
jgi:hypothetical protein